MQNGFTSGAVAALLVLLGASTVGAQDFYKGKELTIYTGSASGGPYDAYARLIARHLVRNIPGNTSVIVQSMPGASGRRMMGYMQNLAPKDGTVIAAPQRAVPFDPLTESDSHFDAQKFGWLGSANSETNVCMVWHTSPLRIFADLYSKERSSAPVAPAAPTPSTPM